MSRIPCSRRPCCCFRRGSQRPQRSIRTPPNSPILQDGFQIVAETPVRVFSSPDTPVPEVQLLSNGRYHVMITNAGGGYSRWKDIAVTRWREDSTCDNWGTFCYIRDVTSGEFWSTAYQPTLKQSKNYEAIFSEGRAEFRRRDHDFDTHTEIVVSPEDDIELRRIHHYQPLPDTQRRLMLQVMRKLFSHRLPLTRCIRHSVISLFRPRSSDQQQAILCTRRPRSLDEQTPWMFHLMAVHGAEIGEVSYETDRMQFIGRGNTVANPQAMSGAAIILRGLSQAVRVQCSIRLLQFDIK